MKGATAYEFDIGDYWKWKPWRRVRVVHHG